MYKPDESGRVAAKSETRSAIYGPVQSWRAGVSLGVDLLLVDSICSFRCLYCQLGKINQHTAERRVYVPTAKVIEDLQACDWQQADTITLSGSGEPTLALNLGEVIRGVGALTGKAVLVLTNSAHLGDPAVRQDLMAADKVYCKLDATDETTFERLDRPVEGITLQSVVDGIKIFRAEFPGFLAIQFMLTEFNKTCAAALAGIVNWIGPDELQINAPLRPVPHRWSLRTRGDHTGADLDAARFRTIGPEEAKSFIATVSGLTGVPVISAYDLVAASGNVVLPSS
jgi:wyosine [tRNA(Phe)-imidazoG37] synthetase (radical SAM superfamily)